MQEVGYLVQNGYRVHNKEVVQRFDSQNEYVNEVCSLKDATCRNQRAF